MATLRIHPGMPPERLAEWRAQQPGRYTARNGEVRKGWSQKQAASWYGVSTRQWQRYESGDTNIPLPLIRRIQAYGVSFDELVDRIMDAAPDDVERWGSPFEALEHEDSAGRDISHGVNKKLAADKADHQGEPKNKNAFCPEPDPEW